MMSSQQGAGQVPGESEELHREVVPVAVTNRRDTLMRVGALAVGGLAFAAAARATVADDDDVATEDDDGGGGRGGGRRRRGGGRRGRGDND